MSDMPYRVVDRDNYGWYQAGTRDGGTTWTTGPINGLDLEFTAYPDLVVARRPVRPVLPVTDADEGALCALFEASGRKTIATLAAALEDVFRRLRESRPGGWQAPGSYDYAKRTMMAGRAGSWEADLLISVIMFGNGLNLAKPSRTLKDWHVDARRAAGPTVRVGRTARDAMAAIVWRWVNDTERYTEVAGTLAGVVSRYCDARHDPDGWRAVADQWLQPGSLSREDFSACYRLLYSQSEHYDSYLT